MQSIDREPLFYTQFAKQKVCPVVPAVQVFLKTPWEKEKLLVRSNFSFSHIVFFSNHLENFLPISSNLKLSPANTFSFKGSKIQRLRQGEDKIFIKSEKVIIKFLKYCYFSQQNLMFIMLS